MRVIYKITNNINNKSYIGQTNNFNRRISEHKKDKHNYPLYNAVRKYGKENFTFELLTYVLDEFADEAERYAIEFFNTLLPNGYNLEIGGCINKIFTQDHKDKISKSNKDKLKTKEHRQNMSKSKQGCVPWNKNKKLGNMPQENKDKISKALIGHKVSDSTKIKIGLSNKKYKGRPWSEKRRQACNKGEL